MACWKVWIHPKMTVSHSHTAQGTRLDLWLWKGHFGSGGWSVRGVGLVSVRDAEYRVQSRAQELFWRWSWENRWLAPWENGVHAQLWYSCPRNWTHVACVSCIGRQILYHCTTWEAPERTKLEIKKISSFMKGQKRSRENQIKLTWIWDLFSLGVLMEGPASIQLFKLGAADNQAKSQWILVLTVYSQYSALCYYLPLLFFFSLVCEYPLCPARLCHGLLAWSGIVSYAFYFYFFICFYICLSIWAHSPRHKVSVH